MQFNAETNGLDLYTDCRFLCGLETGDGGNTPDTTSYPIKAFARNANFGLDRVNALILKADGWTVYDDANNSGELLDVSNTLTSGTQKLAIAVTWLKIGRVRIKDISGNWIVLPELPRRAQGDVQLRADSGQPSGYFRLGNYIYFDKTPNYTAAGGIEIQFQRGASYFAYTGTDTKVPGFATQFHRIISLYCGLDFCEVNGLADRAASIRSRIGSPPDMMNNEPGSGMEKEIVDFYSMRDTDLKPSLSPQREDYGQMGLGVGSGNFPPNPNPKGF